MYNEFKQLSETITLPKLSICIASYNRGKFIGETLDSILCQMLPNVELVELVVLDGASPDNTADVMTGYVSRYPAIRYIREQENSGIDRDYDKAVAYAKGEYCWLMTDDDLLRPGALSRVLTELDKDIDLVVVNTDVKNANLSKLLNASLFNMSSDKTFGIGDGEQLFQDTAQGLSFIGCVIIRRDFWLSRNRESYYGTLFIHVGVIFQSPSVEKAIFIAEPLLTIRYGNAAWTSRGFEIWMFKWPQLVWSFNDYFDSSKAIVHPQEPWRRIGLLGFYRAIGGYGITEYRNFIAQRVPGFRRIPYLLIAIFPAMLMNSVISLYCLLISNKTPYGMYSLVRSHHATWVTRGVGRVLDVGN